MYRKVEAYLSVQVRGLIQENSKGNAVNTNHGSKLRTGGTVRMKLLCSDHSGPTRQQLIAIILAATAMRHLQASKIKMQAYKWNISQKTQYRI